LRVSGVVGAFRGVLYAPLTTEMWRKILREGFQMLVKGEFHTALLCALRLVKRGFLQKDVKEVENKQKVYRLKQTYTPNR